MYVMLDTANGNFFYNSPNEAKKLEDLLRKKYPKIFDNYDVKHVFGKNSKGKPAGGRLSSTLTLKGSINYPKFVSVL